jgi:hypothetical protein
MDFMEKGNLWDALQRVGRTGKRVFQWYHRGKRVALDIALGLHYLHDVK